MRATPVVALAALLACLPARAVELIDLHDLRAPHGGGLHAAILHEHSAAPAATLADMPASLAGYRRGLPVAYMPAAYMPAAYLPGDGLPGMPVDIVSGMPLPAGGWPVTALPAGTAAPTPVPEPVAVLMLACGLLLIMPGAWAARSSRLGDTAPLLQRQPR